MKKFLLSMVAMLSMGFAASAAEVTITGNDFSAVTDGATTATKDGITIEAKKGSGPTAPALNPYNDVTTLRAYATNTITISGEKITKVVFNLNTSTGYKRYAKLTASTGTLSAQNAATSADDMDATITWTGDAASVTFTVADKAELGSEGANKAGQVHILSFDVTGEGGENPGPGPDPQPEGTTYTLLTTMAPGNYIIGADDNGSYMAATSYADGKTYGYIPAVAATVDGNEVTTTADPYTFEAAEGGYYIKDAKGNYLIQTGTYNSFNLVSEPSATEGVFTVAIAADGYATIVNKATGKTMAYGVGFTSFGSYPELSDTRVLPKLYVGKSDAINEVNVDNSNAPVEFFNLQGMRINEPAAGQIVIRRQGNQVSKIFVK